MADYAGQQLGNYRLRHRIGRGGAADVYLGEHIHLETLAAIKVLHMQMGSNDLDDFRREFPALADVAEVETMGGLLTHLLGVVPEAGASATFQDLKFTVQIADERRVRELLVQRLK